MPATNVTSPGTLRSVLKRGNYTPDVSEKLIQQHFEPDMINLQRIPGFDRLPWRALQPFTPYTRRGITNSDLDHPVNEPHDYT